MVQGSNAFPSNAVFANALTNKNVKWSYVDQNASFPSGTSTLKRGTVELGGKTWQVASYSTDRDGDGKISFPKQGEINLSNRDTTTFTFSYGLEDRKLDNGDMRARFSLRPDGIVHVEKSDATLTEVNRTEDKETDTNVISQLQDAAKNLPAAPGSIESSITPEGGFTTKLKARFSF
jgi:hypothetical protein